MRILVVRVISPVLAIMLVALNLVATAAQDGTPPASPEMQESRAIAFYPEETGDGTFITIEVEPGESATANVILGNSGNIDQTLRTYAIPALSGTNGGFVIAEYGTPNDKVTDWVNYPETEHTFAPTEGVIIPVEVSVPEDVAPGEYVTGLAAEQAESFEVPGTDMFKQRVRWSIPVLIVVSGERAPAFELGEAKLENQGTSLSATIEIANTGNVIVRPVGEVRLIGSDGAVVGVTKIEMGSVYTGTATTLSVGWANVQPDEQYDIEVLLTAEEGSVTVERMFTDLVPSDAGATDANTGPTIAFSQAELTPATTDSPPSLLLFNGEISNNGEPIEDARVSIVTYKDGEEVDRYPIMQAVTIEQGTTPVEARYSLPGGFTTGTYTFEVTIELGDMGSQTVLVTQPLDYELTVP